MGLISKFIEKHRRFDAIFRGEYIIELMHRVDVEDDIHPFYYYEKEFFLFKAKQQPKADIKQLTGKNAGTIYTDVETAPSNKGIQFLQISVGEFSGEVNINKYLYEKFSIRELEKMARKYNKNVRELAKNNYEESSMDEFIVNLEFQTDETEPLDDETIYADETISDADTMANEQ